ncbi:MAG TPA: protein-disulfide reductase DsbD domain-containing protein [Thermoanaerobaculia bacterium]
MRRANIAVSAALATVLLASLAGTSPLHAAASAWTVNGPSRLRLVTPYRAAPAAGEARLGVEFRTEPGWHVYWKNSGDAGYPPTVRWSGDGLAKGSVPELLWPAPERFDLPGGLVAFGYEGEAIYPVRARLDAGGRAAVHLAADVDYVVCQVECIPFRSQLALDQPVASVPVADPETAAAIDAWWRRLPAPVGSLPGASAELRYDPAGPALEVELRGVAAGSGADLFFEPQELFDTARPQARPLAGGIAFRLPLARRQVNRPLPAAAVFAWTATGLRGPQATAIEGRAEVELAPPLGARGPAESSEVARPVWTAALATLALLAALALWGILARSRGGLERGAPALRQGLGFLAFAGALGLLYRLSREVAAERLAEIELAFLGIAFLAWANRSARGVKLRWALAAALLAVAVAVPWLAMK